MPRWPTITTRKLMALIVLPAVALGLGLPAWEVTGRPDPHLHSYVVRVKRGQGKTKKYVQVTSPVWPRYWLRLRGRPWTDVPVCTEGGELEVNCALAHPGLSGPEGVGEPESPGRH